jgi:hypothetical protein
MAGMDVSLITPVRQNSIWIEDFVKSFREMTVEPKKVELLLGISYTDTKTRFFDDNIQMLIVDDRKRRWGVGDYQNKLASISKGKLLWMIHDDCRIKTKGWDQLLAPYAEKYAGSPYCLLPNKMDNGGTSYPMVTRKYYDICGRFTGITQSDAWIWQVFKYLPPDRTIQIDELIMEDRRFSEHIPLEAFFFPEPEIPGGPVNWHDPEIQQGMKDDAEKLKEFIKNESIL